MYLSVTNRVLETVNLEFRVSFKYIKTPGTYAILKVNQVPPVFKTYNNQPRIMII